MALLTCVYHGVIVCCISLVCALCVHRLKHAGRNRRTSMVKGESFKCPTFTKFINGLLINKCDPYLLMYTLHGFKNQTRGQKRRKWQFQVASWRAKRKTRHPWHVDWSPLTIFTETNIIPVQFLHDDFRIHTLTTTPTAPSTPSLWYQRFIANQCFWTPN